MNNGTPPHDLDPADMWDLEVTNESYSETVYPDSVGIPTIGIGHNLTAGGPAAIENLTGHPSYADVVSGKVSLTPEQVEELFDNDMSRAISEAQALYPNWDDLPTSVQTSLADMAFNMGSAKLSQFTDLANAIANEDWSAASDAMNDSAWANQVGERASRDTVLMNLPNLIPDVQSIIETFLSETPPADVLDAIGQDPALGPGDFPAPTAPGDVIAMNEAGPGAAEYATAPDSDSPAGWAGGDLGDPTAPSDSDDGYGGGGFSGGGWGDTTEPTGDYESDGGYGYGGESEAGDETTGFGGGQAGDEESGGQFGGGGDGGYEGDGGYDSDGGYGGYGEGDDGGQGDDGGGGGDDGGEGE